MADPVAVLTRRITRDKLAKVFNNHEAIKLIEDLTRDVGTTLPGAVNLNIADIQNATQAAMIAVGAAAAAKASAFNAETMARDVTALLKTMRNQSRSSLAESVARESISLLQTIRTQASDISTLRRELDEVRALIQGT